MKRRPRKVIATVLVFLLLGAIVNIAVAWGCALWAPLPVIFAPTPTRCPDAWPAYLQESWPAPAIAREHVAVEQRIGSFGVSIVDIRSIDAQASVENPITDAYLTVHRFGIPARSMQWEDHRLNAGERSIELLIAAADAAGWRKGIRVSDRVAPSQRLARRLPITAIWPGFAINTLFYAAILWLLLALPGALRRWRRIKRGLCPACAYPVGASDLCTECGKPIPTSLKERVRWAGSDSAPNDAPGSTLLPPQGNRIFRHEPRP